MYYVTILSGQGNTELVRCLRMASLLSYARLRQTVDKMTDKRNLEIRQTLAGVGAHDGDVGQSGARSFKQRAPKPSGNQAVGNETTVASSPSQRYDIF